VEQRFSSTESVWHGAAIQIFFDGRRDNMPIAYRIDEEEGVVFTTATGVLTDDDILQHKSRLANDTKFKPGMRELSDVRGIESFSVTAAGVRNMASEDERHAARIASHRLAIVVSAEVAYDMACMYQNLTNKDLVAVEIFRNMEEARVWLGITAR
jgi:hypothetical protein